MAPLRPWCPGRGTLCDRGRGELERGNRLLRWAAVRGHPLAIAFWQLLAGTAAVALGLAANGADIGTMAGAKSLLGLTYGIIFGSALAYLLWFNLVRRLSAGSAAIGTLLVPVVGVTASILVGERPRAEDMVGFGLILVAALLALLPAGRAAAAAHRSVYTAPSGSP